MTRAECVRLRDGRQTQTVTLRQLDEALAAVASALHQASLSQRRLSRAARWPSRQCRDHGRHRQGARDRTGRPAERGYAALGAARSRVRSRPIARTSRWRPEAAGVRRERLAVLESTRGRWRLRWSSASCSIPTRQLLSIGYLVTEGGARSELLRSAGLRGAARQLLRHRQGRRPGATLVPPRPLRDAGRAWRRADLLVGIDVRISDAVARHARAGRKPARADQPSDRAAGRSPTPRNSGLPWGISESAYNARDLELTYQYSNFGVPGLGLKRGLGEDRVIAPYATALAAMVDPRGGGDESRSGWPRSARKGATASTRRWTIRPRACRKAQSVAIVRAFMAHHQGMTIVAIADALLDGDDAGAVPCRTDRQGDRTASAGAHAARRRGDATLGRGSEVGRRRPQRRAVRRPAVRLGAAGDARHASAFERPLFDDAHRRRLGLQPLGRSGA